MSGEASSKVTVDATLFDMLLAIAITSGWSTAGLLELRSSMTPKKRNPSVKGAGASGHN